MTLSMPRAVIFDWDNTLVDSWNTIMIAMNGTLQEFGKAPWTLEEVRARCKLAAKDYFPALFGAEWEKAFAAYYRIYNANRISHGAKPRPGAFDLLRWLKAHNIPAFVVSNKRGDYLRDEAKALGWTEFFVTLIGATDTPNSKPSREPVDAALGKHGLRAGPEAWFVGDTDVDMQCARNAGCTPVFIGEKYEAEKLDVSLAYEDCGALLSQLAQALK